MKKFLLSILSVLAITSIASAEKVAVVFGGYNYTGDATQKIEFAEGNESTSINDEDFSIKDVCNFMFCYNGTGTLNSYIDPSAKYLMWQKKTMVYFYGMTADITVKKITFACADEYKSELEIWDGGGTCTTSATNIVWEGSRNGDIMLSNESNDPINLCYMEIEYDTTASTVPDSDNNKVAVVFGGYNYTGDATQKIEFAEGNESTSINDEDFSIKDVCNFMFCYNGTGTLNSYIDPSAKYLMWQKKTMVYFYGMTADITVKKITFACADEYKSELEIWDGGGTCTTSATNIVWEGSRNGDIMLSNESNDPINLCYMEIEYTNSTSSIDSVVTEEADAPAEYFNLLGVKVASPKKGNIYIKRQGNKTTKVIM